MTTGTPVVVSRIQNRRGTQEQFDNLYPTYPGVGPHILQPGELALCTDTRRVFIGNLNGEYVELTAGYSGYARSAESAEPLYQPVQVILPPSPDTFTFIPELEFSATPFLTISYSLTDATGTDSSIPPLPTEVGINISKNGELRVTANDYEAALVDLATEINTTNFDISFKAEYTVDGNIGISYTHNFPINLTFSTYTIVWSSL